jgi:HD superfamily phosphodiesterase
MKKETGIVAEARSYVEDLFKKKLSTYHHYHSFTHTDEVAQLAGEMSDHYELNDKEKEILLLSAYFHDTGYTETYEEHEEKSIEIATNFLGGEDYPSEDIEIICSLIESTKPEKKPENLMEEILHDADISHVGRKDFFERGELLRVEWEIIRNKRFDDIEWEKLQLRFLVNTRFYTSFANEKYILMRGENIRKQKDIIEKVEKKELRKKTGKDYGRGIDTLYRTSYRNHINLSSIADGKANMMISINTIIMSVIITIAGSGLSFSGNFFVENLRFTIPVFILLIGCLSSVVFAILSAKPTVTKQNLDNFDIRDNTKSFLFFGNFVNMALEKFSGGMRSLKSDEELLYDKMSIDMYYLGKVLSRKYRLLSFSYLIFMIALILSVVSFIFIFFYTYNRGY